MSSLETPYSIVSLVDISPEMSSLETTNIDSLVGISSSLLLVLTVWLISYRDVFREHICICFLTLSFFISRFICIYVYVF